MKTSGKYVLDSFAALAFLEDEVGADKVRATLEHGRRCPGSVMMSVINVGECAYIVEREQGLEAAHRALAAMEQWPVSVMEANRQRVFEAAHIKARYKVSYADAFAIALAVETQSAVVTGDPEFEAVEALIPVVWLSRND